MFEAKKIEGALRRLFGFYREDRLEYVKGAYAEEIESLSVGLLARKYARDAHEVCEYKVVERAGEDAIYQGQSVLDLNAVCVAEEIESQFHTDRLWVDQVWELWLLEDMSFAAILNTRILVKTDGELSYGVESRLYMYDVDEEEDPPVSAEALICALDDVCLFERVVAGKDSTEKSDTAE